MGLPDSLKPFFHSFCHYCCLEKDVSGKDCLKISKPAPKHYVNFHTDTKMKLLSILEDIEGQCLGFTGRRVIWCL